MKRISLTEKEKLFCYYYANLHNPKEAAIHAGFPSSTAEKSSAKLLLKKNIQEDIERNEQKLTQILYKQKLLAGVLRLAFGRCNDAVKLAISHESLTDEEIDKLDLFLVSEFKKQKDGAFEVKLFDRLKALDKLDEISQYESSTDSAAAFYQAIQESAQAIHQQDLNGEEDEDGEI